MLELSISIGIWSLLIVLVIMVVYMAWKTNNIPIIKKPSDTFVERSIVGPTGGVYESTRGYDSDIPANVTLIIKKNAPNRVYYVFDGEPKGSLHQLKWMGNNQWVSHDGLRATSTATKVIFSNGTIWTKKE